MGWREEGGGGGDHNDFDFGTFIGRFRNVGAARMAVKGLISMAVKGLIT